MATFIPERPTEIDRDFERQMAEGRPNGPALAAILGAGIGTAALGILTTLAEASPPLRTFLTLSSAVGPLSGKTLFALAIWIVSFAGLFIIWRRKNLDARNIYVATFILIGVGFVGTFPIFFEAFTRR